MLKDKLKKYLLLNEIELTDSFYLASEDNLISNLNAYIKDQFFYYEIQEMVVSNFNQLPKEFFWVIKNDAIYCQVKENGVLINQKELVVDFFNKFQNVNIFHVVKKIKIMNGSDFYLALFKSIPLYSIVTIFFVLFSLLSPLYTNLFNHNLIYNNSLMSVLYVTIIFVALLCFEFFLKKISSNYTILKMKAISTKVNSYLGYILFQSKVNNISSKVRAVESSAYASLEASSYVIPDIALIFVYSIVLSLLLGVYSIALFAFYIFYCIFMVVLRYGFYKRMLNANPATYDRISRVGSLDNKYIDLRFLNENALDLFLKRKNESDEINKMYISKHNHHWSELGKASSFISTIVMFITSYVAIQNGALLIASIMGIMIVNSRLCSTITSLVVRFYQLLIYKDNIKKYIDEMFIGYVINTSNLSAGPVDSYKVRNLSLTLEENKIFSGISVNLAKCHTLGILGSVGSGKTSLLNALSNIETKYTGIIEVNNLNINDLSSSYMRSNVAYYNSKTDFIYGTLKDNFDFYGVISKEDIFKILKVSCPRLPLTTEIFEAAQIDSLPISNGEKQKLLILMMLNKQPSLIFLDEPTSFLSENEGLEFIKFIRLINPSSIIFIATHDNALIDVFTHKIIMS